MTTAEVQALACAVKLLRGRCLDVDFALKTFLRDYPHIDPCLARAAAAAMAKCPFPSIDGNPPVERNRPYLDVRFWARYRTDV